MVHTAIAATLTLGVAACAVGPNASTRRSSEPLTLDSHVDIPRSYMREARFDAGTNTELRVDLGKMERGGLDAAFFVIFVEQGPRTPAGYAAAFAAAENKVSAVEALVRKYPDRIRLATSPADLVANHAAGRLSALMGIENGFVIGKDLARLDALYARGARYLGLTHTGHNDICTSSGPLKELGDSPAAENVGLSPFGESVVRRANALGMLVDVSHASDACVRDVLRLSAAPIIASHSSARALTNHARNLRDELMRAIAAKGGVVHMVAYTGFLRANPARDAAIEALEAEVAHQAGDTEFDSARHEYLPAYQQGMARLDAQYPLATLDDYLDHIQHAVAVAGIDHVGIASDFDGGGALQGWRDASETGNVTAGLRRRGFTEAQIGQLWSGNLLRAWREAELVAKTSASRQEDIDAIFDAVMKEYHLPGMALGVMQDGKVTYTRTAGELVAGGGRSVDADTLFKIASNTKAMTTGLLARLVDAGKLQWDDPVVKYLPQFRMYDPWVSREMRVRDLLIHNSGLREGAGDLMLWPEPNLFTRADIIAGLAHLKPVRSFRSHYDYDNLMYIVAGEVAAAAGGAAYEQLMRREVFEAVGLKRCQVGAFDREAVGNVAQPHRWEGDRNLVYHEDPESVPSISSAAAGGVRCSLNDMLTWMRMWLDPELRPPGQERSWLSRAQHEALWTSHTPMPMSELQRRWNNGNFSAYGYGWRLSDVDGVLRVSHTGTLGGMYSAFTLLPDKRTGFVFMINGEGSRARTVLNAALVKLFTAPGRAPPAGWYIEQLKADDAGAGAAGMAHFGLPMRKPAAPASMTSWLGRYRDPWFGEISICARDRQVRFNSLKSPLMAGTVMRVGERLLADWDDVSVDMEPWLEFSTAGAGKPIALTLAKTDPEGDFSSDYEDLSFTRIGACRPQAKAVPMSDVEATARIDQLMRGYAGEAPGASVLVLRDGQPVVQRSYGRANLEERTPVSPLTNYRLASITKQFTAAAVLLLSESNKLGLDDPVRQWLPELPEATQPVTIRHLLTHTGGLIDYEDFVADDAPQVHDADVLRLLAQQDRTYFKPGTNYRYSNSGYALLALIVERASAQGFATFLRERIFQPLGMSGTVAFEDGVSTVSTRAYGYSANGNAWNRTDQSSTSAVLGDGGIYSSVTDLAKWDAALYDDRLLSRRSRDLAFTPATHTDNPSVDYGFGWRISGETLWHSGETRGFRNVILRFPERHLTVIVLTNRNDPEPYSTALDIAQLFLPGARP